MIAAETARYHKMRVAAVEAVNKLAPIPRVPFAKLEEQ